ncbi:hypothetical protein [Nitrospira tepida]|nr:hypothetical protein [Nitrospira tepida]
MARLQDDLSTYFAQHVLDPNRWIATANHLMSAAERLAPDIEQFWKKLDELDEEATFSLSDLVGSQYQNIFMMLYGFAIENLCKAHVVTKLSKDDRLRLKSGRLPNRLNTHDLEDLVTRGVGLAVDNGEKELLKTLEAAVKWAGRYPVSTGPGNQKKHEIKEQLLAMPQGFSGSDLTRTRQLARRIKDVPIKAPA